MILKKNDLIIVDCCQDFEPLIKVIRERNHGEMVIALIENKDSLKESIFSIGAQDYITSPIIPAELLIRVQSCFCFHQAQEQFFSVNNLFSSSISHQQFSQISTNQSQDKTLELVQRTCRYLLLHLSNYHSLDGLSRKMATNRNILASSFKKVLGASTFSWLREQRLKRAETLIRTTSLSIQEISCEVGYQDPANFSTAFKKHSSISPHQYRKKMMESKELMTDSKA